MIDDYLYEWKSPEIPYTQYRLRCSDNDENTYDPVVIRILLDEIRTQGMQKPLLPVFPPGAGAAHSQ